MSRRVAGSASSAAAARSELRFFGPDSGYSVENPPPGYDIAIRDDDLGVLLRALTGSSHSHAARETISVPEPRRPSRASLAAVQQELASSHHRSVRNRRGREGPSAAVQLQPVLAAPSSSSSSAVNFFPLLAEALPAPSEALNDEQLPVAQFTSKQVDALLQHDDVTSFRTWWLECSDSQLQQFQNEYEGSILLSVVRHDSVRIAQFLLEDGISVEDAEREFTALMIAVENQVSERLLQLLLRHGANLTGEFSFNDETPFSFARFKACQAMVSALAKLRNMPKAALPGALARLLSAACRCHTCGVLPAAASPHTLHQCIERSLQKWRVLERASAEHGDTTWRFLAIPAVEPLLLPIFEQLSSLYHLLCAQPAMASLPQWKPSAIERALGLHLSLDRVHANIQRHAEGLRGSSAAPTAAAAASSIGIDLQLHAPSAVDVESPALLRGDLSENIASNGQLRLGRDVTSDALTRIHLQAKVSELNRQLATEQQTTISGVLIAEFRGLHYYDHHFTSAARALHQQSAHLNRLAPAPALFSACGRLVSEWQLTRESHLQAKGAVVKEIMAALEHMPSDSHDNQALQRQERMSNDYAGWAREMAAGEDDVTQLFYKEGLLGYPHVAHSELPDHALRYALGEKTIESLQEHRRLPFYDAQGRARHVYLGKLFITLCSPEQLREECTTKPVEPHNRQRMNLDVAVAPEREIAQPGSLSAGRMFYEELLAVPSFHHDKMPPAYQTLYGFSPKEYKEERIRVCSIGASPRMDPARLKLEGRLLARVRKHISARFIKTAATEAQRRGSQLIFMHSRFSFGLYPEPLRVLAKDGEFSISADERGLLKELDRVRFPKEKQDEQLAAQRAQELADVEKLQAEIAGSAAGARAVAAASSVSAKS